MFNIFLALNFVEWKKLRNESKSDNKISPYRISCHHLLTDLHPLCCMLKEITEDKSRTKYNILHQTKANTLYDYG